MSQLIDLPLVLLSHWTWVAPPIASDPNVGPRPDRTWVFPDGCQDLIRLQVPGHAPTWLVAPLADTAYCVHSTPEAHYEGYRLRPGAALDPARLLSLVESQRCDEAPERVLDLLAEQVGRDERIAQALGALAEAPSVGAAARDLGVSVRSLNRLVQQGTQRPPVYWRRLARLRRAAQDFAGPLGLADLAALHGFADQAHLSRECLSWLGRTPSDCRRSPTIQHLLAASGYGNEEPRSRPSAHQGSVTATR